MIAILVLVGLFVWWALGIGGLIFSCTSEADVTTEDIPFLLLTGFLGGPMTWGFSALDRFLDRHQPKSSQEPVVLFRRRGGS